MHRSSSRARGDGKQHAAQGWGNVVNTAVLCALLAALGQTGGPKPYSAGALTAVWRLSFAAGLAPLAGMLGYRLLYVKESELWSRKERPPEACPMALVFRCYLGL